jgi:hypothetical protein
MRHIPAPRQPFFLLHSKSAEGAHARPLFSEEISKTENQKTVVVQTKYDLPPVAKDAPKTSVTTPHLHTLWRVVTETGQCDGRKV